jgi:hypothetical protein
VGVYVPYYPAYQTNRYVGGLLPAPVSAANTLIQAASLSLDAGVDYVKRKAGTSPHEGTFDENPPGQTGAINAFHSSPNSKPQTHLPGLWKDSKGGKHVDIAPPWSCKLCSPHSPWICDLARTVAIVAPATKRIAISANAT